MPLQATSGAASYDAFGGGVPVAANYIEDVFSTWLYTGTGTSVNRTITNGVDLAGNGGLVWTKSRSAAFSNVLNSTALGFSNYLVSNSNGVLGGSIVTMTANSNGYTMNDTNGSWNNSGDTFASWTFREQPKFFDVVTWTGDGNAGRTIAHNLGSVPGCIIVKATTLARDWWVYHRSLGATKYMLLNATDAVQTGTSAWNDTEPTSTVFSVGNGSQVNSSGQTYVAYVFAHNAGGFGLSGTDNVISCGSFTGNGSTGQQITLGYEPQFIIMKQTNASDTWRMYDNMRGLGVGGSSVLLQPSSSNNESTDTYPYINATGFTTGAITSGTFIYIAIRRGPMRTPTTGTSVFAPVVYAGNGTSQTITTGFANDMEIIRRRDSGDNTIIEDKLRGSRVMFANTTSIDLASTGDVTGYTNTGFNLGASNQGSTNDGGGPSYISWNFQRAPGYFDVCCYTGTGANRTVAHTLTVTPELMLVKRRSTVDESWAVYSVTSGNTKFLRLDSTLAATTSADRWNNTSPTSSVFTVGIDSEVNASGQTYVAYLFASIPGVSKVGSYTGNGSNQTVNCGFTGGARFILIKRTDSTGDWYVWDTARGIVSGNDPHLSLNTTAVEVTGNDTIDPDSSGFIVNQRSATNVNVSSATYIYLAIA